VRFCTGSCFETGSGKDGSLLKNKFKFFFSISSFRNSASTKITSRVGGMDGYLIKMEISLLNRKKNSGDWRINICQKFPFCLLPFG